MLKVYIKIHLKIILIVISSYYTNTYTERFEKIELKFHYVNSLLNCLNVDQIIVKKF